MKEQVPGGQKRMETVAVRLQERMVDDRGDNPDPDEVAEVVEETAERFADAPVQEFVPLLVEHQAGDELRERGLHAQPDERPDDAPASGRNPKGGTSLADIPMPPR